MDKDIFLCKEKDKRKEAELNQLLKKVISLQPQHGKLSFVK